MIEIFKNWIISMLCLGVFVILIQLIIPKTNIKKYIYSLIGIITIITIVSPVINLLKNQNVEDGLTQVLSNLSGNKDQGNIDPENMQDKSVQVVESGFIKSFKKDIESRLATQNVETKDINIKLDSVYDIEKIEISIKKLNKSNTSIDNVSRVVDYISQQYDISYSKISVVEEGV